MKTDCTHYSCGDSRDTGPLVIFGSSVIDGAIFLWSSGWVESVTQYHTLQLFVSLITADLNTQWGQIWSLESVNTDSDKHTLLVFTCVSHILWQLNRHNSLCHIFFYILYCRLHFAFVFKTASYWTDTGEGIDSFCHWPCFHMLQAHSASVHSCHPMENTVHCM